jgi:glycosyltransferase involved in cell wall biosynthesis
VNSKIRLAVNARRLVPGKIGGLENAFRDVFDVLLRRYYDEFEISVLATVQAADSFANWKDLVRVQLVPEEKDTGSLASILESSDVLYCPFFHLEPERPALPSVLMIPDLQHEKLPENFSVDVLTDRLRTVRSGAAFATRVLTISENSKQQIIRCFHLPDEHVYVTHLDCAREFYEPTDPTRLAELRRKLDLPPTYLLFPANNWPHKNHRGLFRAIREHRKRFGSTPPVVLTGALVDGLNLSAEAVGAGVSDLVRHVGYVEKSDMPALYDGAACLVFVSQFEGFGIPVVEAMRRGTPVVASDVTSLPELVADNALLVDPEDTEAIAEALHQVLAYPDAASARTERARQWVARFSYEKAAERTAELFRQVSGVDLTKRPRSACRPDAKPSVFVVTPSFNQGEFLRDTIDSVLSQDYENLEYFVADGGSTDESVDILESYGDRLRWVSEPDGGQAAAIAEAWKSSDAEIVAWLNSDDTYLPGAVGEAVHHLLAHPEQAMVYGKAWYTDRAGNRTEPYPTKPFDPELLRGECFICQPAAFVRHEVLRVIDPPDPSLEFCMDYDLWIRLSKQFEVGYLEKYLATSRMYESNKTLGQRDGVYEEVIAVTRKNYGEVARSWSMGYANHVAEKMMGRLPRYLPAFVKRGLYRALMQRHYRSQCYNPPPYEDGWASYRTEVGVQPDVDGKVVVEGDNLYWPYQRKLVIRVEHEGRVIARHKVANRGTFRFVFWVPSWRSVPTKLTLRANRTFVPKEIGLSEDERALSFRILGVKSGRETVGDPGTAA